MVHSNMKILGLVFDGDTLNLVMLKTKKLQESFKAKFDPVRNMFISRNDGLFDNDFNLFKDQIVGLAEFNSI